MSFIKYPSLLNHYRSKEIEYWLELYPELENEQFIVQEKLHGANVQFIFTPDGEFNLASRNQLLNGDNFMGINAVIDSNRYLKSIISFMRQAAYENKWTYNFYGEFFGGNIQKGVDYGKEKRVLFFDLVLNGQLLSQEQFLDYVPADLNVPVLDIVHGLDNALTYNSAVNTLCGSGICEGVVIKPFDKVYQSPVGATFMLKKKNDEFKEKQRQPKPKPDQPNVDRLNELFLSYITEQRMYNVFSKEGSITEPKEIGKYIRLILEDAKEEFVAENEDEIDELSIGFEKAEWKSVYNCGALIANMLKAEM